MQRYWKAIGGAVGAILAAAVAAGYITADQSETLNEAILNILLIALSAGVGGSAGAYRAPKNED